MKKMKIFILPFLLVGLLSVVFMSSFTTESKKADPDPVYYWFDDLGYVGRHQSEASEVPSSGCLNIGSTTCEIGYSDDDFNTTGNPYSGLKTGATPDEYIMKN